MRSSRPFIFVNAGLLFVAGLSFAVQHRRTGELRAQLAREQALAQRVVSLAQRNRQLQAEVPNEVALAALEEDKQVLPILRRELNELEARANERLQRWQQSTTPPDGAEAIFTSEDWFNAGRETPVHAIMTALWASASGDVDVLKNVIRLDQRGEERLETLWSELPAAQRAQFEDKDRFIAALAARTAETASIEFLQFDDNQPEDAPFAALRVRIAGQNGEARTPTLITLRDESGWRLLLPAPVLDLYYAKLPKDPPTG